MPASCAIQVERLRFRIQSWLQAGVYVSFFGNDIYREVPLPRV